MRKLGPEDKARFQRYVADANQSPTLLAFLLDNLGEEIVLDYSVSSLAKAEATFWKHVEAGLPADITDSDHFAQLLGQYLGECICFHTGANWVQCREQNPMFGQPCVDGFGGNAWDRVYPVETALHLRTLPQRKPEFPGVRERRVLAKKLETAMAIHKRRQTSK